MKNIKLFSITALLITLFCGSSSLFAAGKAGSGPNPYRDCGIGAALFPETHWAAVTSNVIWDIGTTAVTSATSSPETCSGANVQTAQFIIDNYDNLVEETAKGEGEYLTTVLDIQGCDAKMQNGAILAIRANVAQSIYSTDYNVQSQVQKASNYYDAVASARSSNCSS